ncbi:MAG: hypothetical protein NC489_16415 [Ruminococcus flavefaciens]|nr:hypothetical protein [Ruminococcus flavefaciens]
MGAVDTDDLHDQRKENDNRNHPVKDGLSLSLYVLKGGDGMKQHHNS